MADAADMIMDLARSRLPGAVDRTVYFELAQVLDEFFKTSTCWRERILVPVFADTLEYELESVEYPARVHSLLGFENGDEIAFAASMPTPQVLALKRALEAGDYYAWVVLTVGKKPVDGDYPPFPDWVADRYADTLADGIAGRMMAQPAKPYSSPAHARYYMGRFRSAAMVAKTETNRHHIVGAQAWRFPRFAAQR